MLTIVIQFIVIFLFLAAFGYEMYIIGRTHGAAEIEEREARYKDGLQTLADTNRRRQNFHHP